MLLQALALHLPGGLHGSLDASSVEHGHTNGQRDHAMYPGPEGITIALCITRSQDLGIDGLLHCLSQHLKARDARLAFAYGRMRQEIHSLLVCLM